MGVTDAQSKPAWQPKYIPTGTYIPHYQIDYILYLHRWAMDVPRKRHPYGDAGLAGLAGLELCILTGRAKARNQTAI